jgi:hypothetical protein
MRQKRTKNIVKETKEQADITDELSKNNSLN